MRDDVINHSRGPEDPLAMALDAQRIASQERLPCCAPPGAISSLRRRASQLIYFPLHLKPMLFARAAAGFHKHGASRIAAWMLWGKRAHLCRPPLRPDLGDQFLDLHAPVFIGEPRMLEVRFVVARALNRRRSQARAVTAERLQECARIAAVPRA